MVSMGEINVLLQPLFVELFAVISDSLSGVVSTSVRISVSVSVSVLIFVLSDTLTVNGVVYIENLAPLSKLVLIITVADPGSVAEITPFEYVMV